MSAPHLSDELRRALIDAARAPRLLVASDYDGTMAPIVPNPVDARPRPESVAALRNLATLDGTVAAVISGRALRDLATLSRLPAEVHLVGSHGSEFDIGFIEEIDDTARELLARVRAALREIVDATPGATLEPKPASVALHVRNTENPDAAREALQAARTGPAAWPGVQTTEGKAVIELSVVTTDKGNALDILRRGANASATVFLGDDVTDEKAFRRLHGPDVGIKVGEEPTGARFRVRDTEDVARVLAFLLEQRRAWLLGADAPPIERLTLLASPNAKALLTPTGSICWLCHPDPDSAALFASLIGGESAGHFTVGPEQDALPLSQEYAGATMTAETRWAGLLVTDYMPHPPGRGRGRVDIVRVISGTAPARVQFAPRPEFGQVRAQIEAVEDGLVVVGTNDPIVLRSPGVRWRILADGIHQSAEALVDPSAGPVQLELRCGTRDLSAAPRPEPEIRAASERYWDEWARSLALPALERPLVRRSALTLRGLVHADTGSILAAATTSLPEEIGGVRNWDYRYCWLRDASMTASALVSVGSTAEAAALLDWLHRVLDTLSGPERLNPLYTLDGTSLPPEAVLDALPGYAGSRPVRVGNAANQQVQLDVFGPITELIADLARARRRRRCGPAATGPSAALEDCSAAPADPSALLTDRDWSLVLEMTSAVAQRWTEPDNGIWEIRGAPRHHVYSKVMCWVTIDRALGLAAEFGRTPDPAWAPLRERIAAEVTEHGWSAQAHSYTAAYDGVDLDAASLFIGLSGLLPADDPRFAATVSATEAVLRSGSTVYRYHSDDGLPGSEGGFHLCAAWLVEAYLLIGQRRQAEALFRHLVSAAGPTGLLSEEYDPVAERALGNHPQAYSHIGLIRCARLLSAD